MKKFYAGALILSGAFSSSYANPGDTTLVQAHNEIQMPNYGNYDNQVTFPDGTISLPESCNGIYPGQNTIAAMGTIQAIPVREPARPAGVPIGITMYISLPAMQPAIPSKWGK